MLVVGQNYDITDVIQYCRGNLESPETYVSELLNEAKLQIPDMNKEWYNQEITKNLIDYFITEFQGHLLVNDISIDGYSKGDDWINEHKKFLEHVVEHLFKYGKCGLQYNYRNGIFNVDCINFTSYKTVYVQDELHNLGKLCTIVFYREEILDGSILVAKQKCVVYYSDRQEIYDLGATYDDGFIRLESTLSYIYDGKTSIAPLGFNLDSSTNHIPFYEYNIKDYIQTISSFLKMIARILDTGAELYSALPDSILLLKNYEGTDLDEARAEMSRTRMAKVSGDGDMKAIIIPSEAESADRLTNIYWTKIMKLLGLPVVDDFGNQSGVSLNYLFKQLNTITERLQNAINESLYDIIMFYNIGETILGRDKPLVTPITCNINPDIIIDEAEKIKNINDSRGFIDDKDLLAIHPFYKNLNETVNRESDIVSPQYDLAGLFNDDDITKNDLSYNIIPDIK